MSENQKAANAGVSAGVTRARPKSYMFLVNISRQLGARATKQLVEVKSFLHYDAFSSPARRFLATMPHRPKYHDVSRATTVPAEVGERESGQGSEVTQGGVVRARGVSSRAAEGAEASRGGEEMRQGASDQDGEGEELDMASGLQQVVQQSHEVLCSANTVFPVKLFPDTVFVDRTKVTIIRRNFFWSSDVMSIRIEDVLNVSASVGPLFGSLTIASRVMSTVDHFRINHFWRNDAINLKHVIQGYVIAQHNHLDTKHLSKDELVKTLVEIGHDSRT